MDEVIIMEQNNTKLECECSCDCDEVGTETDDQGIIALCEICSTHIDDNNEIVCSRMTTDFTICHICDAKIDWTGILTGQPGTANHRIGSCKCGNEAWGERELGNWGNYGYEADEDEIEMRKIAAQFVRDIEENGMGGASATQHDEIMTAFNRLRNHLTEVGDNWSGYAKGYLQDGWQTWLELRPMDEEDSDDMAEWDWNLRGNNPLNLYIVVDDGGQNRYIASKSDVDFAWENALTYDQFHELHSAIDVC